MAWRRVLGVGAVLLLLAGGCTEESDSTALSAADDGGATDDATTGTDTGDDASTSTTTTSTSTSTTTSTTTTTTTEAPPPDAAADRAAAQRAVDAVWSELQGQGFERVREEPGSDDDMPFTSPECRDFGAAFPGEDDDLPGQTAKATVEVQRGGAEPTDIEDNAEVTVTFVRDPAPLDALLALFEDQRVERCLEEAFTAGSTDGGPPIEIPDFYVERFDPGAGDRGVGLRMGGTFAFGGFEFPFVLEVELFHVDRAAISVAVGTFGAEQVTLDREELREILLANLET